MAASTTQINDETTGSALRAPRRKGVSAPYRSARRIIEFALVAIAGIIFARICLLLFAPLPLPQGDRVAAAPSGTSIAPVSAGKNPFPSADLIAEIGGDLGPAAPDVAETTLDLTLRGVFSLPEQASAQIELPDGKQRRFAVGEEIVSGATLDAVYPDQVTILRGGVREALRFENKITSQANAQGAAEARAVVPRGRQTRNGPPKVVRPADIGALGSVLRAQPSLGRDGQLAVEIYAQRNRAAFAALGFRDGDKLKSIDGAPVPTNPAALIATLNGMQRKSRAVVVVERGGEEIPLEISLTDIGIE